MSHHRHSILGQVIRGAIGGAVATWAMDAVTTAMFDRQSPEVNAREAAAQPMGKGAVPNLIDRVTDATGLELDESLRPMAEQATHYALGVIPGAFYAVLRERIPFVGALRGLLYGLLLFVVNDEYLNIRLGLAGPVEAYPVESHARGLVGHLVLGAATDTMVDVLGG